MKACGWLGVILAAAASALSSYVRDGLFYRTGMREVFFFYSHQAHSQMAMTLSIQNRC